MGRQGNPQIRSFGSQRQNIEPVSLGLCLFACPADPADKGAQQSKAEQRESQVEPELEPDF